MSKVHYVFLHLTLFSFVRRSRGLTELPQVEENNIMETEGVIRTTINQIFTSLKLKVRERPKLKQYGQIHNYFTSVTLRDYNNLKEIAQLTRVDNKNNDNTTLNFIALINAILNGDSFAENEKLHANSVEYISEVAANYLQSYLNQLNYFEEIVSNGPRVDVNKEVAKILASVNIEDLNITETIHNNNSSDEEQNVLGNYEFRQPVDKTRRIYKGKRTRIKTFPFMAVIQAFNVFQCAGSIVHSDLVLTAASCLQLAHNNRFYRENPAYLSVRVGSNFYDVGGEVVPIMEVFFHPSYNPKSLKNNLALVRLVRHLKLTKKKVKKIAIDTTEAQMPSNTRGVTIVGWGATTASNVIKHGFENKLSYANLDIYNLKDCQDIYSKEYVTQKNFCAGFISKGSGACNRDVGGPGVVSGILGGVVSFGSPHCGTPDAPTVFTKVGFYADWIEKIMDQDVPRGRRVTTLQTKPWTWSPQRTSTVTDFKVVPVYAITRATETLSPGTTTGPPIGRHNKKIDMKLFREFLRTMLDSKEIEEYLDQFMSEKGIGRDLNKPTTEALPAVEFATKNVNFEPEPEISDDEGEWTTEVVNNTSTPVTKDNKTKQHIDAEKEEERDIIELINNADLREILLESVSTAKTPNEMKKTKKQKKKNTNKMKEGKKKIKVKHTRKGPKKEKKKKTVKKANNKNIKRKKDKDVMTFLYLTDDEEKYQENNLKIFNKADDGMGFEFDHNLSKDGQDSQNIALYMTREEINDESIEDNAEEAGNGEYAGNSDKEVYGNDENNNGAQLTIEGAEDDLEEDDEGGGMTVDDGMMGSEAVIYEAGEEENKKEGMSIDFDKPTISEISNIPGMAYQPLDTQINFSFRAQDKDDSQLVSKKTIIDILNEVMIAE